jgi:hypothetical protein
MDALITVAARAAGNPWRIEVLGLLHIGASDRLPAASVY